MKVAERLPMLFMIVVGVCVDRWASIHCDRLTSDGCVHYIRISLRLRTLVGSIFHPKVSCICTHTCMHAHALACAHTHARACAHTLTHTQQ